MNLEYHWQRALFYKRVGFRGEVDASVARPGRAGGNSLCRLRLFSPSGFNRIDEILADGSRAVTGVGSRRVVVF